MPKKVAIVHEMLVKLGGAEKVVQEFMKLFPDADIFTLMYDEKKVGKDFPKEIIHPQVFSLPSQKRYSWTKRQRLSINLMARSVEQLDLSQYDLVLCSSSSFAHGCITKPETQFIVYYHSPSGYLWHQTNEYKKMIGWSNWIKWFFLNKFFLKTRMWDFTASARVDTPVIASEIAGSRIKKYYNRDDYHVIYPPVETQRFQQAAKKYQNSQKDYYITISALTEWKKVDVIINAFNKMPDQHIKIIWIGDQEKQLRSMVTWNNIEFVWYKSGEELEKIIAESKWGIFSWVEDFWIAAVEVMAAGKPVFWIRQWWITETSIESKTWEFYDNEENFIEKFQNFHQNNIIWVYSPENCQNQAEKFSSDNFWKNILKLIK